jgi:ribose transport system permease protein
MIVVANGMNLVGISSLWQQLVIGVVVILAVWFDVLMKKTST